MHVKYGVCMPEMMLKEYNKIFANIYMYLVKKPTNNVLVYAETGRFPLKVCREICIFKFWFKYCVPKIVF